MSSLSSSLRLPAALRSYTQSQPAAHTDAQTHTQMRQMKAAPFPSAQPVPTNLQMKSFAKSVLLLLGHGSTLCVWGRRGVGGEERRGFDRGCVRVCVAGAQMKQPSPGARCPPAVAASLFLLPRPVATICSINQSPGASVASAHTHPQAYILQQLLAQLMPHMGLHPSLHSSLPPALLQTHAPSFFVEAIWPSEACGSAGTSAYMLLLSLKVCTVSFVFT